MIDDPYRPWRARRALSGLPRRSRGGELSVSTTASSGRGPRLPVSFLQGLRPVGKGRVPAEALAGITLAALAIPEVMGYTKIAGMPVVTGLYTILLPLAIFAVLGSSRHLVVGADSATAAIMFAALTPLAVAGSPQYVALAGMLALHGRRRPPPGAHPAPRLSRQLPLAHGAHRVPQRRRHPGGLRASWPACSATPARAGGPRPRSGTGPGTSATPASRTLAVSVAVLLTMVLGPRLVHRVPWALLAVIGATVASAALSLSAHGVGTIGAVPRGLPQLGWPSIPAGDYREARRRGALHLRRHPGAERRHLARLRGQVRRRVRRERRPRRPGRGQHRRRPLGHVRGQRQSHQDGDGGRRRRPQPARAARHCGRRPRRAAGPHQAL